MFDMLRRQFLKLIGASPAIPYVNVTQKKFRVIKMAKFIAMNSGTYPHEMGEVVQVDRVETKEYGTWGGKKTVVTWVYLKGGTYPHAGSTLELFDRKEEIL